MTIREKVYEYFENTDTEAILFDDLDAAIIGIANQHGSDPVVAYSEEKIIKCLMKDNKWDYETAQEWYDFNIACLGVSKGTPVIIQKLD
jgi:hypothetical protein